MTVSRKQKIVAHAKNLCCFILLPPISFNKHHVDIAIIPLMKLISISYDCLPSDEEREQIVKRLFDIIGGLIGSAIGLNGRRFKMYKLRSMYMDAEARKQELMKQNQVADGRMFKMENDPRIIGNQLLPDGTWKKGIGDFIRRTSLDEFPQFFNVLLGQMSLVGTRRPTVDEWESYEYHHRARLACKPGITGLWQVSGRQMPEPFGIRVYRC